MDAPLWAAGTVPPSRWLCTCAWALWVLKVKSWSHLVRSKIQKPPLNLPCLWYLGMGLIRGILNVAFFLPFCCSCFYKITSK